MPESRSPLSAEQRAVARFYGRQLGIAAAALSLIAALVSISAASNNWQEIITVQRALIDLANQGDALLIPPLLALAPMLFVTYLVEVLTFLATLALCHYAGRVAAGFHRDADMGSVAGAWVVLVGGGVWLTITAFFTLFTQLDGTFAWFFATIADVLLSSSSSAVHVYVSNPDGGFIALHLLILLIQNGLGMGFAVGVGSLIGRRGASRVMTGGMAGEGSASQRRDTPSQ